MEKWRDIPGYEALYQASTEGRIRTCEGKTTRNARFAKRVWKQRILKQKAVTNRHGRIDARVNLWKDGENRTPLVSRLVAATWCDGYRKNLTVNHIDGNPLNNRAENLEWVSLPDNIRKGFATGLYAKSQKKVLLKRDTNIIKFASLAEADRFLGRKVGYTSGRIRKGSSITDINGNAYKAELYAG